MRESTLPARVQAPVPAMSEADLQRLVTDAATLLGYLHLHVFPLRTAAGWATPTAGQLGAGWPDLLLCRPKDQRVIALELKSQKGHLTADQIAVMAVLAASGIETHVVRPSDIEALLETLK